MFNAGLLKKQYQYSSFSPNTVNHEFRFDDSDINMLNAEAMRYIGLLEAYSTLIPDIDFFIKMHVIKEATTSSKIEGTQTGIEEAVSPSEDILPERRDDWVEVQNYIMALNFSIKELNSIPLSIRLLREAHKLLLDGVRGENKLPGEIRRSQNWIGGSNLSDASFIPPHHDELPELLSDLEKFWHNEGIKVPVLIKCAISHYQFETIHPFLDGNGRIGRLLITLQLVNDNILSKPTLYISDFFEKNRAAYYDSLTLVRKSNEIEQWIKFFLNGVIKTSQKSIDTFQKIIELRKRYENLILDLGKSSKNAQRLLQYMYGQPIVDARQAGTVLGIVFTASNNLLQKMVEKGILKERTGYTRNRKYILSDYVELFKS